VLSLLGLEGPDEVVGRRVLGSKYGNAEDWVRERSRPLGFPFETRDWLRMCLDLRECRV